MKYLPTFLLLAVASIGTAKAQETVTVAPAAPTKITEGFFAASPTKIVKNAPFSAEGVSESVQVLADGNRITRTSTTKMYRDSDGRFRRDGAGTTSASASALLAGVYLPSFGFQETISIYDPVEAVRYLLNPSAKTARRYANQKVLGEVTISTSGQALSPAMKARVESSVAGKANVVVLPSVAAGFFGADKTEQLGTKSFEGVAAEGKRTVTIIEAGKIGNEKPIEIVDERWYSKELEQTVYSRHYDPRFGEQIYRLVNISRSEPDRSLFTVPSDYKITAENPLNIFTTKQK